MKPWFLFCFFPGKGKFRKVLIDFMQEKKLFKIYKIISISKKDSLKKNK